jgi:flagellar basal-body rod protein FlgF
MDRMIYLATSGAKQTMGQQATVAHNLANLTTTGFRGELSVFRAVPLVGAGANTRTFVVDSTPSADFTPGAIQQTGRDLDVAVQGRGWIAVQAPDGSEAYTRNGSLQINSNGVLQTRAGHSVMGDGGTIAVPADTLITIAGDGTLSTVPTGTKPAGNTTVGRIKLVNPPEDQLERGADGLFRVRGGGAAAADPGVKVVSGSLEASNVNAVEQMVSMISLARQYDMHIKLLQNAEANSKDAAQLLSLQG